MITIEKIFDGRDKAKELGYSSYRDMVIDLSVKSNRPWMGETTPEDPVYARVDFGRWLADCECGGASYVDPDDPIFYCATCGNQSKQGYARLVIFPDNKDDIEKELLTRKVKARLGLYGTEGAINSVGDLSRSWNPGESIETLKHQKRNMEKVRGGKHGI